MRRVLEDDQHELFSLNVILMVGLLGISIFCAYLMKKYHFYYVPESAAAMLMGVIAGGIARLTTSEAEREKIMFSPDIFFFLLMPPIIFEAGYTLKRKRFFTNISTILLFAVVGTVISTFVVGLFVYGCAKLGLVNIATDSPLQSFLFGALISAVDPVATLSIMGSPELNCDKLLYALVFGESVLNDAVAVVLFKTFASLTSNSNSLNNFTGFVIIVLEFLGISIASVIVGVLLGLAASALFRHTKLHKYPHKEIVVLFMFAYLSYAIGEALYLSGIMALFFCGIVLSHYNWYNLSDASKVASAHVFKGFAMTTETMVFAYLGISLFSGIYDSWNFGFAFLAIVACLLGRACNIAPLSWLANFRRKRKITGKMQFVMWFAGLRGAIAFALALNMPNVEGKLWDNDIVITTTLIIVIFTTVVCGGLTEPLLRKMELKQGTGDVSDDEAAAVLRDDEALEAGQPPRPQKTGVHNRWARIDEFYMKPLFGGKKRRVALQAAEDESRGYEMSALHSELHPEGRHPEEDRPVGSPLASKPTPRRLGAAPSAAPAPGAVSDATVVDNLPTASSSDGYARFDGNLGHGSGSFFALGEHEIFSLDVILMSGLLGLSIFLAYLMKKYHFYYVPESAAAMLMGVIAGGVARLTTTPEQRANIIFSPEIFFFLLMPPIIFEAGYTLKRKRFFTNISTILLFAVVGTVISTFVVGLLVFGCAKLGLVNLATDSPLQSLLFGTLISAGDTVATLAIMGTPELNCDQMLYSLVFGESVLNDAVAVVLFKTFSSLTSDSNSLNDITGFILIVLEFLGVSIASVIVGVLLGLGASAIFKHTKLRKYPHKEIVVLFLFAYLSYAIGEALYLSGIMALFFCGMALSHYNWYNLSDASKVASAHVFKGFAMATETMVFTYLGISLLAGIHHSWDFGFAFLAIIACLIGRACSIFPLSWLANVRRKRKITTKMQVVLWFAGLRGAMAFALAMNMPNVEGNTWDNDVITTTTLIIVIFTTVVFGGLTEPLLRRMELKQSTDDFSDDEAAAVLRDDDNTTSEAGLGSPSHLTRSRSKWRFADIDEEYMRPLFGGKKKRSTDADGRDGFHYASLNTSEAQSPPGPPPAPAVATFVPSNHTGALPAVTILGTIGRRSPRTVPAAEAPLIIEPLPTDARDGDLGAGSGSFFGAK